MSKFTHITTLPVLPDHYINEGMSANYELKFAPCSYRIESSFDNSKLCRELRKEFGVCFSQYVLFKAGSYYDWHCDIKRNFALNWLITTTPRAISMYRSVVPTPPGSNTIQTILYDVAEINYTLYHPVLLNTSQMHAVVNPGPDDRIILTVSVNGVGYEQMIEWLAQHPMDTYD